MQLRRAARTSAGSTRKRRAKEAIDAAATNRPSDAAKLLHRVIARWRAASSHRLNCVASEAREVVLPSTVGDLFDSTAVFPYMLPT